EGFGMSREPRAPGLHPELGGMLDPLCQLRKEQAWLLRPGGTGQVVEALAEVAVTCQEGVDVVPERVGAGRRLEVGQAGARLQQPTGKGRVCRNHGGEPFEVEVDRLEVV